MADSNGTVDCNLDSNYQKQSVHAASETLWGSLDSTSRSHATVLHETSPMDMANVRNERLEKSISTHHSHQFRDANAFVGEASAHCKDHSKTSSLPLPIDLISKKKCLQVRSITPWKVKPLSGVLLPFLKNHFRFCHFSFPETFLLVIQHFEIISSGRLLIPIFSLVFEIGTSYSLKKELATVSSQ